MSESLAEAEHAPLPLFYIRPEPLSADRHGDWRVVEGNFSFAAATPCVPILVTEMPLAARDYPIVFAAGRGAPIALVGLDETNLFLKKDGCWEEDSYVPAYVRRYPFAFMAMSDGDRFQLAIDTASPFLSPAGSEGAPLFENGRPGTLTQRALDFCAAFGRDARATEQFAEALAATDLLVDRTADATLPNGHRLGLEGFRIVDAQRFAALSDEIALDWRHKGWLELVHAHLWSLERFAALLRRRTSHAEPTNDQIKDDRSC